MVREVPIRGQMIRLGQLLKLVGAIDSGAEVKAFLAAEQVSVNGEREGRRGRQLHPGDVVRVGEMELRLTVALAPGEWADPGSRTEDAAPGSRVAVRDNKC